MDQIITDVGAWTIRSPSHYNSYVRRALHAFLLNKRLFHRTGCTKKIEKERDSYARKYVKSV